MDTHKSGQSEDGLSSGFMIQDLANDYSLFMAIGVDDQGTCYIKDTMMQREPGSKQQDPNSCLDMQLPTPFYTDSNPEGLDWLSISNDMPDSCSNFWDVQQPPLLLTDGHSDLDTGHSEMMQREPGSKQQDPNSCLDMQLPTPFNTDSDPEGLDWLSISNDIVDSCSKYWDLQQPPLLLTDGHSDLDTGHSEWGRAVECRGSGQQEQQGEGGGGQGQDYQPWSTAQSEPEPDSPWGDEQPTSWVDQHRTPRVKEPTSWVDVPGSLVVRGSLLIPSEEWPSVSHHFT